MPFAPDTIIKAQPWLGVKREYPPRLMLIHGTGSGVPYADRVAKGWNLDIEFSATINWFESAANRAKDKNGNLLDYGACSNYVIGAEGQRAIAWGDDYRPTWSAGWGLIYGWALDHYAISYEVCQPGPDWPFTDEQYERLGWELARLHKAYGVELVMLPYLPQIGDVPSGVCRHDLSANGRAYGKTDPGPLFDGARVIAEAKRWLGEEDDMPTGDETKRLMGYEMDGGGNYPADEVVIADQRKMRVQALSVSEVVACAIKGDWKRVKQIMSFFHWGE